MPVDPEYPADRIAYMLNDSQVKVLLTQKRLQQRLSAPAQVAGGAGGGIEEVVLLDDESIYAGQPEGNIGREETGQTSSNLAYVIYTSGSTGQPKGVMVEHRSLGNLVLAQIEAFGLETAKSAFAVCLVWFRCQCLGGVHCDVQRSNSVFGQSGRSDAGRGAQEAAVPIPDYPCYIAAGCAIGSGETQLCLTIRVSSDRRVHMVMAGGCRFRRWS